MKVVYEIGNFTYFPISMGRDSFSIHRLIIDKKKYLILECIVRTKFKINAITNIEHLSKKYITTAKAR